MARKLNVYYAAARDLTDGSLAACKIIASTQEIADKKARKYFNNHLHTYEYEVVEQDNTTNEDDSLKAGVYYMSSDYAYYIFC